MKKIKYNKGKYSGFKILSLILFLFFFSIEAYSGKIHFGIISAIKNKIKQMKTKRKEGSIQYRLTSNTRILRTETQQKLVKVEDQIYYFDKQATEIAELRAGDIFIGTMGNGYLRKVVSVRETADEYIVETTTATIVEAFEMLKIRFQKEITPEDVEAQTFKSLKLPRGVSVMPAVEIGKFRIVLERVIEVDSGEIKISGELTFTPTVELNIDMPEPGYFREFYFNIQIVQEAEIGVNASISTEENREIKIADFPLGTFPIGPIVIVPEYELKAGVEASISGDTGVRVRQKTTLSGGLSLDGPAWVGGMSWEPHFSFSKEFSLSQTTFTATAEIKGYIKPEISFKLYDILGPFVEGEGFLKGSVTTPLVHLPWDVSAGIGMNAGLKAEFDWWIGQWEATWEFDLFEKEWELLSGIMFNQQPEIVDISVNPSSVLPGESSIITCSASDSDGDTLTYSWNATGGLISGSGAEITWIAPSEEGTYTITCIVDDGYGGSGQESVNIVVQSVQEGAVKWEFPTGDCIASCPAIGSDGTIYFGSYDGKLYAVNPDGTKKWEFSTSSPIFSSPAIDADGTIYFGSWNGKLYAINPDGTEKWEFWTSSYIISSPAIGLDGTIYIGSNNGKFYAINPDGTKKWELLIGDIWSSPAIGPDGTIYIGNDRLYAINSDGTVKWEFLIGGMSSSPSIDLDGTIYVGSHSNRLYAINPDGTKKWELVVTSWIYLSSPAIGPDGTIYVASGDGRFYAVDPDGTKKWELLLDEDVRCSPLVGSNRTVYIGSCGGYFYAIDSVTGKEKWKILIGGISYASPTMDSNGMIYIGSDIGRLYAIESFDTLADTPWPKFRQNLKNTGRRE